MIGCLWDAWRLFVLFCMLVVVIGIGVMIFTQQFPGYGFVAALFVFGVDYLIITPVANYLMANLEEEDDDNDDDDQGGISGGTPPDTQTTYRKPPILAGSLV